MYEQRVMIRETQIDIFGHMNNSRYLEVLEDVRWNMVEEKGFGLAKILSSKTGPIVLGMEIKYLKELKAREWVKVTVELLPNEKGPEAKIQKLKQQMIKDNGEIACEATFAIGFFDMVARKLLPPSPEWKFALGLV